MKKTCCFSQWRSLRQTICRYRFPTSHRRRRSSQSPWENDVRRSLFFAFFNDMPVQIPYQPDMPVQIPYQPQKAPVIPVTLGERRKTISVFTFFKGMNNFFGQVTQAYTIKLELFFRCSHRFQNLNLNSLDRTVDNISDECTVHFTSTDKCTTCRSIF